MPEKKALFYIHIMRTHNFNRVFFTPARVTCGVFDVKSCNDWSPVVNCKLESMTFYYPGAELHNRNLYYSCRGKLQQQQQRDDGVLKHTVF